VHRSLSLYHTLTARGPNSLGLALDIDAQNDWLRQVYHDPASTKPVHDVTWELPALKKDLAAKHRQTFWVRAKCRGSSEDEEFHYVEVQHTRAPAIANFTALVDPLKPEDAMSQAKRDTVNGWYSRTLLSRLNNKARDAIILVQQRVHMDDLAGHVEALDDWVTLSLPAIAEEDALIPIAPGVDHARKAGDVLHPEREPLSVLENLKLALGSATFSAQYQQCPVPPDGEVVKWSWFRRYSTPPTGLAIQQSWDTASKPDEHCDFSVCTTWGTSGDDLYLLHVDRARLDFPGLKRRVIELAKQWRPRSILIEDKAAGTALIQQLRTESHGIPYPTAFVPRDDKLTRLHAQSARIEAGHVWLPERASWLEDLRVELAAFPQGRHDDQVDSVSQFLAWFFDRRSCRLQLVPISGF
jgi:predicted phage terminase large subunit-like protein